jgi:hypothetical protein
MFIIKALDDNGVWQHFNVSDQFYFSSTLAEIFEFKLTDIEVYARINYNVEYSPGDLWD